MIKIEPKLMKYFKNHEYGPEIIMISLYMKGRYSLSYREIEEIGLLRGVNIDHATLQLIILKKDMLNYVISKYKNNIISEEELVEWANLIECRDDIAFEKEYEKQIKKTIFSIANPDLVDKEYIKNINSL